MTHVMNLPWEGGLPLMVGPFQIGHAEPSPETAEYWKGIRDEKLMIKRCSKCGAFQHPRRLFCTTCSSDGFNWQEVCGRGSVYSFSTVYRAPTAEFAHEVPYTVGLVLLEEGVHLFTRIVTDSKEEPQIDAPVEVFFQQTGSFGRLPAFRVTS